MTSVKAIKAYFEDNSDGMGRKVEMAELKELGLKAREELGQLCCKAMGIKWEAPKK